MMGMRFLYVVGISVVAWALPATADDFDWETGANNDNGGAWGNHTEWAGPSGEIPDGTDDTATIADVGAGPAISLDADYTIGDLTISNISGFKQIWFGDFLGGTPYELDTSSAGPGVTTFSVDNSDVTLSGRGTDGTLRVGSGVISGSIETGVGGRFHRPSIVSLIDQMQLIANGDLAVALDSQLRIGGNSFLFADSITVGARSYTKTLGDPLTQVQPSATIDLLAATHFGVGLDTDQLDLVHGDLNIAGGISAAVGEVTLGQADPGFFGSAMQGNITIDGNGSAVFSSIDLVHGDILITNGGSLTQSTSNPAASNLATDAGDAGSVTVSNGGIIQLTNDMTFGGEGAIPLTITGGGLLEGESSSEVFVSLGSGSDAPVTHVVDDGTVSNVRLAVSGNALSGSDQTVLNVSNGSELDLRSLVINGNSRLDITGVDSSLTTNEDDNSGLVGRFGDIELFVDGEYGELLIRDGATLDVQDAAVFRDATWRVRGGTTGAANTLQVDQGGMVDIAGAGTEVTLNDTLYVDSNSSGGFVQDKLSQVTIRDEARLLGLSDLRMFDNASVRFLNGAKGAFDDADLSGGVLDVFGNETRVNVSGTNTLGIGYTDGGNITQSQDMVVNVEDHAELNSINLIVGDTDGTGRLFGRTGAEITTDRLEIGTALGSSAAVQLQDDSTLLTVNGDAIVGGPTSSSGLLNVLSGALADINGELIINSSGDGQVLGGTLEVDALRYTALDNSRDLQYGTVRFTRDTLLDTFTLNGLLSSSRTLGPVQTLDVEGEATFAAPLTLAGGTLMVDQTNHLSFVTLDTGTFRYRGDGQWQVLEIDDDGPLGPLVEVKAGLTIQGEARTISGDGYYSSVGPRVEDNGLVRIHNGGTFQAIDDEGETFGIIDVDGEIELLGPTARLLANNIDNAGLIHGAGRVDGRVTNRPSGRIEALDGERLVFTGFSVDNDGIIAIDGGTVETQELVNGPNNTDAQIIITDGTLIVTDDFDEITNNARISGANAVIQTFNRRDNINNGTMAFTGKDNRLYGNWTNQVGGVVSVGGAGKVTFFNEVTQNGQVLVTDSSLAVFLGDVDGSGTFTGDVEFAGTVQPGNSPGAMSFANVSFRNAARLIMEIAGLTPAEYDQLYIAGLLEAGGTLQIDLLDGFAPSPGDAFDLFDFAGLDGQFQLDLPDLPTGLTWDDSALNSTGTIAVIPEPTSAILLALASLAIRRRVVSSTRSAF